MTNEELISMAAAVINTRRNGDFIIGDVGCALETEDGNLHLGVCIDTSSSLGFCAEANAIGAMTTAGEARIRRIVAVWKGENGATKVLPPCGRCREFIRQIHPGNLDTEVLLSAAKSVPLRELLPHHDWFAEVE
jgi:cytidine deaminase